MSSAPAASVQRLSELREQVRAIELAGSGAAARHALAFGIGEIDTRLADGGLAASGLHEIAAASCAIADDGAATLFVAGIAARAGSGQANILWAFGRRDLFAPGLAQAGLGPNRLIHAEAGRDADILAVMEEGLRHGGLAAVVGEVGRLGMTATRRLQLAAEQGGTIALLLRRWRRGQADPRTDPRADPLADPSAAMTRWRIGCAPSAPLPMAGVGRPRWHVALARQRGGEPFNILMGGCDAEGRLALPAGSGDRPAPARRRRAA